MTNQPRVRNFVQRETGSLERKNKDHQHNRRRHAINTSLAFSPNSQKLLFIKNNEFDNYFQSLLIIPCFRKTFNFCLCGPKLNFISNISTFRINLANIEFDTAILNKLNQNLGNI